MKEKTPDPMLQEMGNKLANFRRKLSTAIGEKKVTQIIFGDMYGGHTAREITSYERGEVCPPARLLYLIWKSGNSIDGIFSELPIEGKGLEGARELYKKSVFAKLQDLDPSRKEKLLKEVRNAKTIHDGPITETLVKASGKSKGSPSKARRIKKR